GRLEPVGAGGGSSGVVDGHVPLLACHRRSMRQGCARPWPGGRPSIRCDSTRRPALSVKAAVTRFATLPCVATVVVDVMLKPEVHDPQGEAIASACHRLGYGQVISVRQGKRFEIELDGD